MKCEEILQGLAKTFEDQFNIHLAKRNDIKPERDPTGYAFRDGLAEGYRLALKDVKHGIRMLGQAE